MDTIPWSDHLLYGLAWISFGLGHSLLAGPRAKRCLTGRWGPDGAPWYRLAYNAVALVHIAGVVGIGQILLGNAPPFALPLALHVLAWGLVAAGAGFGWYALRFYDTGRLMGLTQLRDARDPPLASDSSTGTGTASSWPSSGAHPATGSQDDEPLRLDGPHRWIRHPLYLAAFLLLWGRAISPLGLETACWGSLYLILGTMFEERRLLALHGEAYRRYRATVPAYLPWKGRVY